MTDTSHKYSDLVTVVRTSVRVCAVFLNVLYDGPLWNILAELSPFSVLLILCCSDEVGGRCGVRGVP